jgi:hypothetical protein
VPAPTSPTSSPAERVKKTALLAAKLPNPTPWTRVAALSVRSSLADGRSAENPDIEPPPVRH